jgi:hypothetical protein
VYCGQCGTQNNEESGNCETCGAPLLITAGTRSCAACGGSLGDHDRFCPTCGAAADDAETSETYDASDSFEEIDIDDIEISELPPWLQDMATSDQQPRGNASGGQPSPEDLPDWLRDTEDGGESESSGSLAPAQQSAPSGVQHQPAEHFSLVSDDDLPEWLKALGEEEPETVPANERATSQPPSEASAVALVFEVPPISRAWLTQGRRIEPSSLASAQQQFSPLDRLTGATEQSGPEGIWNESEEFTQGPAEPPSAEPDTDAGRAESTGGRSVGRIVVFALLLVIILTIAYVVIQGM